MARAIARLASGPAAITTIAAITEANVHRATFCNHFTSVEEVAYAISIGLEEFQLPGYGDRHLGADPANVALRTLRAILDYRAHRRDALFTATGMGEAATGLDRRASPTMNGLRRSGQLASLPLARRLSVVSAERRGEGVRRGVAGQVGNLGEGQLAGPQVVAGEGHPPVCEVLHGRLAE